MPDVPTTWYLRLRSAVYRRWTRLRHPDRLYCFCADCIRCGCGTWPAHHNSVKDIVPPYKRRRGA